MAMRILWLGIALALLVAPGAAQDRPGDALPVPSPTDPEAKEQPDKQPSAEGETKTPEKVERIDDAEEIKVLQPKDVPAELTRLKSKADIKAEVTVRPHHGKPAVFKGVIRNGKLIERFVGRRFVSQRTVDHAHCGVRLWWIGGSDGWMFFRYSNIEKIALTGTLTAEERREIIRRLKAKQDEEEANKKTIDPTAELEAQLEKMSPSELESYMLKAYPAEDGWDQKKLNELKHKQIIENQPLTTTESVFVKYFGVLIRARLDELKRSKEKNVIELDHSDEEQPAPGNGNRPPEVPERNGARGG